MREVDKPCELCERGEGYRPTRAQVRGQPWDTSLEGSAPAEMFSTYGVPLFNFGPVFRFGKLVAHQRCFEVYQERKQFHG